MKNHVDKGKQAEQLIAKLLSTHLYPHYIYVNPEHPKINNNKEVCDILIILKNIALIIQIKDIKLDKHDFLDDSYPYKLSDVFRDFTGELRKDSKFFKNIKQCYGGANQILKSGAKITLENYAGIGDQIDLSQIDTVYCLAYYHGERFCHDIWYDNLQQDFPVHIMCYEPFLKIIEAIYSIKDLINYLKDKEDLLQILTNKRTPLEGRKLSNQALINGGEHDLFAFWNLRRSFRENPIFQKLLDCDISYLDILGAHDDQLKDSEFISSRKHNLQNARLWHKIINLSLDANKENTQYKLIIDKMVDLSFVEQSSLGLSISNLIQTARDSKDGDYCVEYCLRPLEEPAVLYILCISCNPIHYEERHEITKKYADTFIQKRLSHCLGVESIISIIAICNHEGKISRKSAAEHMLIKQD